MQVRYVVHSAVQERIPVKATLNGSEVDAHVPGLTVELVSDKDAHHGHTFRFVPKSHEDMERHRELFRPGAHVRADFTQDEE